MRAKLRRSDKASTKKYHNHLLGFKRIYWFVLLFPLLIGIIVIIMNRSRSPIASEPDNTSHSSPTSVILSGERGEEISSAEAKPAILVTYDISTPTSGNVVATLTGLFGIGTNITNNGGSPSYTFIDNGSFTFTFKDIAGNTGNATAKVDRIDKTHPSIIILSPASGTVLTTGTFFSRSGADTIDIVAYVSSLYDASGTLIYSRIIPVAPGKSYTGSKTNLEEYTKDVNGAYTWKIGSIDAAGNSATASGIVVIIDKAAPVVYKLTSYPKLPLYNSGRRQVIIMSGRSDSYPIFVKIQLYDSSGTMVTSTPEFQRNAPGTGIFIFPGTGLADGIYTICSNIRDMSYNRKLRCVGDILLDTITPTAKIHYSPERATTGYVVAVLHRLSETGTTIINNGGSSQYAFNDNGTFTFEFIDPAGNRGTATANVDRIHNSYHSITPITPASGTTLYTGTYFSRSGFDIFGIRSSTVTFYDDSGAEVYAKTFDANTTGFIFGIDAYLAMRNGPHTWKVTVLNEQGDTTSTSRMLINVNKSIPALYVLTSNPPLPIYNSGYQQVVIMSGRSNAYPIRVTIKLYNDQGEVVSSTPEFQKNAPGTGKFIFPGTGLADGIYTICSTIRNAGYNVIEKCVGDIIFDTTPPTATIHYDENESGQFVATLSGLSESGTVILNNGGRSGYIFTGNGSFTFQLLDPAGNRGEVIATVDRIGTSRSGPEESGIHELASGFFRNIPLFNRIFSPFLTF